MTMERRSRGHIRRRNSSIDVAIASRIRELRLARGMTQSRLADEIGVTYQQVHKYEQAVNLITAGMAVRIAGVFGVPVAALFEGVEGERTPARQKGDRGGIEHLRAFRALPAHVRPAATQLLRAIAGPAIEAGAA